MTVDNANNGNTLFNDANAFIEDVEDTNSEIDVTTIVGEGKKYRTTEDALRSIVHKETHIQKLERENRELRELSLKAKTTEELLKAIQNNKNGAGSDDNSSDQFRSRETQTPSNTPTRDDLLKEVLSVLEERKAKENQELNLSTVKNALITQYGAQYPQALNKLSVELGLSQTEIDNMAKTSPKAFLKLVGVELKDPVRNPVPSSSSIRTPNNENLSGERGMKYYENLRKTNPRLWDNPKTQNEITNQALKLGQKFYEI